MIISFPSAEFDDAVAGVCHGTSTEEEMRALNVLLRANPLAQDEYLIRVELHTRLASDPDLFSEQGSAIIMPTVIPQPHPNRTRLAWGLALAACFCMLAAGIWSLWLRQPAAKAEATSTAVAMLTRVVDARWAQGAEAPQPGSALEPGWLRLQSGLAEVAFYSGARVVIEGPAELQLISPNEAACPTGRLLAEVPEPARGFRVKTAQIDVVDLGTAFGINATQGQTEVHVFKGKVEMTSESAPKQSLTEGQAAMVQGNASPRLMQASTSAFTPMFELRERSLASDASRYYQWRVTNTRLNQDPSLLMHLELDNLSESDWTLRNAAQNNSAASDAAIVGCQRAEGRWKEKQALEFQSVNDRVRLAVAGSYDALTFSAWVRIKGLDRQFNSLFMADGFEPGTIHWLIRKDGVLGLTVCGTGPLDSQILTSPSVVTLDKFGMWLHLAVVLDRKTRQAVQYVNGSPVATHSLKFGPPLRVGAAELGNWNSKAFPNSVPDLIRNLSGSLDEFEIFSRALTAAEIRELYTQGRPEAVDALAGL